MLSRKNAGSDYYGRRPVDMMPTLAWLFSGSRVYLSQVIGSLIPALAPMRPIPEAQAGLMKGAAAKAAFQVWCPDRLLSGYAITAVQIAPYSSDAVTFTLTGPQSKTFEIAQRRSWLPLREELSAARLPFHRVPFSSGEIYVVHGRHGGEPIDHAFWSSRQSVHFDLSGLSVEFREVRGAGPGLPALIRFANWSKRSRL